MSESKNIFDPKVALDVMNKEGFSLSKVVDVLVENPHETLKNSNGNPYFYQWKIESFGLECNAYFVSQDGTWYYSVIDESYNKDDGNIYPQKTSKGFFVNKVILKSTLFKLLSRFFQVIALKSVEKAREGYSSEELSILEAYELAYIRKDDGKKFVAKMDWSKITKKKFPTKIEFKKLGFDLG